MSNIHGLGAVGAKKDGNKDTEEFAQGGKGQSNTAVQRPVKGTGNAAIDALLGKAHAQSAAGPPPGGNQNNVIKITVYANGFILGDAESPDAVFRDAAEPRNKEFLAALSEGDVPDELQQELRASMGADVREVGVGLVDKSSQTFTPPPEKFSFAKSTGQSLGGGSSASSAGALASFASASAQEYKCDDEGDDVTTLQVVTHDRKRVRVTMRTDATCMALHQHVMHVTGDVGAFTLVHGFPPKPIADPSATLRDAGLLKASVTQKLSK